MQEDNCFCMARKMSIIGVGVCLWLSIRLFRFPKEALQKFFTQKLYWEILEIFQLKIWTGVLF